MFTVELTHLFAFRYRRAVTGRGIESGDAGAAGANFLGKRTLRGQFHRQFAAQYQLFKEGVFANV